MCSHGKLVLVVAFVVFVVLSMICRGQRGGGGGTAVGAAHVYGLDAVLTNACMDARGH
jgi:hypothetical protein